MPHWLIIDLEATTDEGGWPVSEMEIIEIGVTLVNRQGRELDHFQRFVRPLRRPLLTPFCRQLTHIRQAPGAQWRVATGGYAVQRPATSGPGGCA